ncbi:MAG: hypothetical protein GX825_08110 [Syntrophomonadaceae bacterium]|nr:hypothetical protein [Syntrophomonadaceae bacterium]
MGKLRQFYPGGNTCQGYYSFYQHIVNPQAARIFVLKGGPGVGKSTFMKKLAREFEKADFNLEMHWCSSDNDSLDALVLSDHEIALLDGTSPHIVDPRYPGAVDEIINLGECWDESLLTHRKSSIIAFTDSISSYFRMAYLRLKEAQAVWNQLHEYYRESVPKSFGYHVLGQLRQELTATKALPEGVNNNIRHLFASAITPQGVVTHATSIIRDYRVLALQGNPGTGMYEILQDILQWSCQESIPVEVYHNCFNPDLLEILVFPHHKIAVVDASGLVVNFEKSLSKISEGRVFDFNEEADSGRIMRFSGEIEDAKERFNTSLIAAIGFINLAKQNHDQLEQCFIPAMNFTQVDQIYHTTRERILAYVANSRGSEKL